MKRHRRRNRHRKSRRHSRRNRGGSYARFVKKHKGMFKRYGFRTASKKIGAMWRRKH